MRSLVFVAVVLSLLSHGFAQQPVLPPGPPQPITPPVVVPTPAPAVDPQPDALEDKFAIVCTIGGEVIGDEIVSLSPGRMLTLTLQGTPKDSQPAVTWALNKESKDISIYPVDGHHVTFTANDGVWLFTAAINNPDAAKAPLLAQRWVVVNGPQPPPVVDPVNPPKPPVVDPAAVGPFRAIIVRDTDADGDLTQAQRNAFQSIAVINYLNAKCVKESDGTPSWRNWDDSFTDAQITDGDWTALYRQALTERKSDKPWICIWRDGKLLCSQALPGTEDETLALLKKYGG